MDPFGTLLSPMHLQKVICIVGDLRAAGSKALIAAQRHPTAVRGPCTGLLASSDTSRARQHGSFGDAASR